MEQMFCSPLCIDHELAEVGDAHRLHTWKDLRDVDLLDKNLWLLALDALELALIYSDSHCVLSSQRIRKCIFLQSVQSGS
ncbi:hypothetical protein WN51_06562 [Melipona quadrifasciata]|uniref:Uncharacterized protein n=1 Tax=Melipona quadrifasciata TaxID=166423 RepID=A0A0N0U3Q2_9HYME|nr:hypothetical protein WN51_06562 [Melipona quadrifasciata]